MVDLDSGRVYDAACHRAAAYVEPADRAIGPWDGSLAGAAGGRRGTFPHPGGGTPRAGAALVQAGLTATGMVSGPSRGCRTPWRAAWRRGRALAKASGPRPPLAWGRPGAVALAGRPSRGGRDGGRQLGEGEDAVQPLGRHVPDRVPEATAVAAQPAPRHVGLDDSHALDATAVAPYGVQGCPPRGGRRVQPDDGLLAPALRAQQAAPCD